MIALVKQIANNPNIQSVDEISDELSSPEQAPPSVENIREMLDNNKVQGLSKAAAWLESYYIRHKEAGTFSRIAPDELSAIAELYENYEQPNLAKAVLRQGSPSAPLKNFPFSRSENSVEASMRALPLFEQCMETEVPIRVVFERTYKDRVKEQQQGKVKAITNQASGYPIIWLEGQMTGIYIRDIQAVTDPLDGDISWDFHHSAEHAENFVSTLVDPNDSLSDDAKDFLRHEAAYNPGPWSVPNHVVSVTQNGPKITLTGRKFEAYYYL